MARCGWGCEDGMLNGKTCVCSQGKRRYFPSKAKKKVNDTLASGHKHTNDKFLYETKTTMWFDCQCGHTFKVEL